MRTSPYTLLAPCHGLSGSQALIFLYEIEISPSHDIDSIIRVNSGQFFPSKSLSQLSQGGMSVGGFSQLSTHQNSSLASSLPISSSMTTTGSSVYQSHYGLNSLGKCQNFYFKHYSVT